MLDGTYRTTKYALPFFFIVVKTNVNYQVPYISLSRHPYYSGTLSKLYITMFLKCNVHYLQLRRQKNMKNIVGVLEVWYSDCGLTADI